MEFINETVMGDYGKLELLVNEYQKDTAYYNETSESIGNAADNVHTSINLVNDMINSIRCAGQC